MKNQRLLLSLLLLSILMLTCNKKEVDFCETQICQHGGSCVNGSCLCLIGWSGEFCQTQLTPVSMKITSIVVEQFPSESFDTNSEADMYVAISKGQQIDNSEFTTNYYENVMLGLSYTYQGTTLTDLN